jgi:hypothetical protein
LSIEVDEQKIKNMVRERIAILVKEVESEQVFWDRKQLEKQTCMSWPFILKTFFNDKRFKKFKVGTKWLFPVKETKEFLLTWVHEQRTE